MLARSPFEDAVVDIVDSNPVSIVRLSVCRGKNCIHQASVLEILALGSRLDSAEALAGARRVGAEEAGAVGVLSINDSVCASMERSSMTVFKPKGGVVW